MGKLSEKKSFTGYEGYKLPPVDLLEKVDPQDTSKDDLAQKTADLIQKKYSEFKINVRIAGFVAGKNSTTFYVEPGYGVSINKIRSFETDLKTALSGKRVRITGMIPGKPYIGIEVENETGKILYLKEVLEKSDLFNNFKIPLVVGIDPEGKYYINDLSQMPHLLVAGTTGSGKSVWMHAAIISILYTLRPDQIKFILVDPKGNEFNVYEGIPHLILPVITNSKKAAKALMWAMFEMNERFNRFAEFHVKDINEYNERTEELNRNMLNEDYRIGKMPHLVVIIDEFSDLMMTAGRDVELAVVRLAQKARAAGIHIILSTQKPNSETVTALIKANMPSKISFKVAGWRDSWTIIDCKGAEDLLGNGDMLFVPPNTSEFIRAQGAYISFPEIKKVVDFIKKQVASYECDNQSLSQNIHDFLEDTSEFDMEDN